MPSASPALRPTLQRCARSLLVFEPFDRLLNGLPSIEQPVRPLGTAMCDDAGVIGRATGTATSYSDIFSIRPDQTKVYARFRPTYPGHLYDEIYKFADLPAFDCALDLATGTGQAAVALARKFARVVATEPNEEQLAQVWTEGGGTSSPRKKMPT